MKTKPVVTLCGLGAQAPEETTLETLRVLEDARVVFTDVREAALVKWLKPFCRKLVALKDEEPEVQAGRVLREAAKGGVAVAVWGHPLLSSRLGAELAKAGGRKADVRVPGAISPAGSAFARAGAFFGGTYGYPGLQVFDAAAALEERDAIEAGLPLVLFGGPEQDAPWAEVFAWLSSAYPKDHPFQRFASEGHLVVFVPPVP